MKTVLFIIFSLLSITGFAQKLPDEGFYKIRISQADKTIVAEIEPVASAPRAKPGLLYYWYSANTIHTTQGGFSGKLLNGIYNEFYLNKNLEQQGSFKKGLKDGLWKSWSEDGTLISEITWKNGIQLFGQKPSIWKRLNFFRKRTHPESDSLKKDTK